MSDNDTSVPRHGTFVVPRHDGRDFKFTGRLVAETESTTKAGDRGTTVSIYVTDAGHIVAAVEQWGSGAPRNSQRAAVRVLPEDALEWLAADSGGTLGPTSKEAWVAACEAAPELLGQAQYEDLDAPAAAASGLPSAVKVVWCRQTRGGHRLQLGKGANGIAVAEVSLAGRQPQVIHARGVYADAMVKFGIDTQLGAVESELARWLAERDRLEGPDGLEDVRRMWVDARTDLEGKRAMGQWPPPALT